MSGYILAIDQGTTSSRAVLVDASSLAFVEMYQVEHAQYYPQPGWVEHDLNEIWTNTLKCIKIVLEKSKILPAKILSIGITNQRETTCAFNRQGRPLARAIVWQDKRTAKFCQDNQPSAAMISKKTGLPLDPYFSATKMNYLLNHNSEVKEAASKDNLLFSTMDTFLLFKLTQGISFKTESTNASRTLLYSLAKQDWDDELLSFFNISKKCLPQVADTFANFGVTKNCDPLPDGIPIHCLIGDQQAALLGQHCTQPGMSKCTYGTGAFLLLNTGEKILQSQHGLLSTVAYRHQGKSFFALEGASFIAGAGVQWFRDQLKAIKSSQDIEMEALKVSDLLKIKHLFFYPYFSGLGSPYWRSDALATITGMSRDSGISELSYALLDGIAQSIADLVDAVKSDFLQPITAFHVDGGACKNNLLMQLQANYLSIPVVRPQQIETTVLGAALGASLYLKNINPTSLSKDVAVNKIFKPESNDFFIDRRKTWKSNLKKIFL